MDLPEPKTPRPSKRPAARENGNKGGRFPLLNTFVDVDLRELSRSEMAAWLVLYRDARDGVSRTSLKDMARRGGMNHRTALRAVGGLKQRGLVEVVRKGGKGRGSSVYRLSTSRVRG